MLRHRVDDRRRRRFRINIPVNDRIEQVIRRQRVLVSLIGPEFSARRLRDRGFGNRWRDESEFGVRLIDPASHIVDMRLQQVTDHTDGSAHVAVQRAVPDGEF